MKTFRPEYFYEAFQMRNKNTLKDGRHWHNSKIILKKTLEKRKTIKKG